MLTQRCEAAIELSEARASPAADARPLGPALPGARLVRLVAEVRPYLAAREQVRPGLQRAYNCRCSLPHAPHINRRAPQVCHKPAIFARRTSRRRPYAGQASGAHAAEWGSGVWRGTHRRAHSGET